MIQLNQATYDALKADSDRLQAIIDGRVTLSPTSDGKAFLAESKDKLRGCFNPDARRAIDAAAREVCNG